MTTGARCGVNVATRCACFLLGLAVVSSPALAIAGPSLQAIADTSVGYTDNLESAPNTSVAGLPPKSPGFFALLSPSLMLAIATPRTSQRLSYTFTYVLVLNDLGQDSAANRLDYQAFFDLSPRASMLVNADVVQSNTDTASGLGQGALLPGPTSYLAGTTDELVSVDLAAGWRAWEGVQLLGQTPLSDGANPQTGSLGGRLGVEYAWQTNGLGVEARSNYTVIRNSELLDGQPAGPQEQLTNTAVAQFRQDLGRHFTGRLEAGAMRVDRLNTRTGFWSPAGAAALGYSNDVGELELSYDRSMTSNPLLGQYLLVDEARLGGAIPIVRHPELVLLASCGYQMGQLLDENDQLAAHLNTLLIDVGVRYQATEALSLGLRYQHAERWSDVTLPPLPLSFTRNTGILSVTYKFPPDNRMPRQYRAPRRVDRTDEIRDGAPDSTAR
jgi:hypothetical protein